MFFIIRTRTFRNETLHTRIKKALLSFDNISF